LLLSFSLAVLFVGNVFGVERGPVETVLDCCNKEFETLRTDVTPGD
jgi:hypothetical protein